MESPVYLKSHAQCVGNPWVLQSYSPQWFQGSMVPRIVPSHSPDGFKLCTAPKGNLLSLPVSNNWPWA